ncbi:MAG: FAD:protein FMN transferase [Mariniblastus sp.]
MRNSLFFKMLPASRLDLLAVFACLLFVFSVTGHASAQTDPTPIEITGRTMGPVPFSVIVSQYPESITKEILSTRVNGALERVNQLMSTYIPTSDVSRFNNSKSTEFVDVDLETAKVVNRSIEISNVTNGAFDITVGPAVNLWNFGPGKTKFKLPSEDSIAETKKIIGYQKLEVRLDPPAIKKSEPGLKIDLSAIAKGYAVDQVGESLDEAGCTGFMVEVGGEIMSRGERAGGGPWRVGVEKPAGEKLTPMQIAMRPQSFEHVATISNVAMATSGDYRNFVEFEGKRYSHTIDPTTCRPVTHTMASACIIAPDCMTADALATAVMVLGDEKGVEILEKMGLEYVIVKRGESDKLIEKSSDGFPFQNPQTENDVKGQANGQSILPTFISAAVIFGLVILAMAVGSIFNNKPVQGSCGGLANMTNEDGETECGICSKPVTDCVEQT